MAAVEEIVAKAPTYRLGGDGSDGTCDCVGLLMGAMDHDCYPFAEISRNSGAYHPIYI
jgi:hypothetical protein